MAYGASAVQYSSMIPVGAQVQAQCSGTGTWKFWASSTTSTGMIAALLVLYTRMDGIVVAVSGKVAFAAGSGSRVLGAAIYSSTRTRGYLRANIVRGH